MLTIVVLILIAIAAVFVFVKFQQTPVTSNFASRLWSATKSAVLAIGIAAMAIGAAVHQLFSGV